MSRMYFTCALLGLSAPRADASRQYVGPNRRFSTFPAPGKRRIGLRGAVTNQRTEPRGELFGAERVRNVRFHAVRSEERRNPSCVDQDVVVALVVTAPRPVVVADEGRHLPHEAVRRRDRVPGDDGPVVVDAALAGPVSPRLSPFEIAQVDREDAPRP